MKTKRKYGRVHLARRNVRDIAHHRNCQCKVETKGVGFSPQIQQPPVPTRAVIIFGVEPFERRVLECLNEGLCLRSSGASAYPCQLITIQLIEPFYIRLHVREIRPAQIGQDARVYKVMQLLIRRRRSRSDRQQRG